MRVKRVLLAAAGALAAYGASGGAHPAPGFESKLSPGQKIEQAINRLTFGARPGDFEAVRKMGLEKWIELQLHPERIAENPLLESRLKPFETIRMDGAAIEAQYLERNLPAAILMRRPQLSDLLPGDSFRKVLNGTAEERRAALIALDPEKRDQVLMMVGDNVVEDLPDLKMERDRARQKRLEEQRVENRKLRPPLADLLDPQQREIALRGTPGQRDALFASLDAQKLAKVAGALPQVALAGRPDLRRMGMMDRAPQNVPLDDLRDAKVLRAIYSNRQLEDVLVDFWFNHFNVFEGKGLPERALLASYERDAIRPHVLGKFEDLLLAVARHPAMLYYLDNWESMAPGVFQVGPFAPVVPGRGAFFGRSHGLNENYGRELMELHTLGVNGGYTQKDVIEVARCFTGWTIKQPEREPEFVYAAFMHDDGEKTVLGHTIAAGGGESDGLEVIHILAHHPSTAHFISTELARRFVADDPPPALVESMARTFLKTGGDLRAVMETMIHSREFFSQGAWEAKVKSPLEMVVSAARALNANVTDAFVLAQDVSDMGEPLYGKEPPTGYKDNASAWLSTANVITRIRFAEAIAKGNIPGVKSDLSGMSSKDPAEIARELLDRDPSAQTMAAMEEGLKKMGTQSGAVNCRNCESPALIANLVISSPDFERR